MPRCVMGELCAFPALDVREGHKCPICLGLVHVFCGQEDSTCLDSSRNVTCNLCAGVVTAPPAGVPLEFETIDEPPKNKKTTTKDKTTTKKKKAASKKQVPVKKKATTSKTKHPSSVLLVPDKMKKSPTAQAFRLSAATGTQDPLIMKSVCFSPEDEGQGQSLVQHFGGVIKIEKSLISIDGSKYLFGNIVRVSKLPKGKGNNNVVAYDVQWEDSVLGQTQIDLQVLLPAIDLSVKMVRRQKNLGSSPTRRKKYGPDKLFDEALVKSLFAVSQGEDGDPMDSDSSNEEHKEDRDDGEVHGHDLVFTQMNRVKEKVNEPDPYLPDELSVTTSNVEDVPEETTTEGGGSRFHWRAGQHIPPPTGKSNRGKSFVKPESVGLFVSPLSSFLAFVPLKLFKSMVFYSNMYADSVMEKSGTQLISGSKWHGDILIGEMMSFFGILIKMVLRPTPGQSYVLAWTQPEWHPYTKLMSKRRFQQIRSVFHVNDNSKMATSHDSLFKVRPVLNCLKLTFPAYLELGDEVALDEASISSRSKYGGFSIFYNPAKPGGKFHFRFYLLCCSTSYACTRIRMHTRDLSDSADGYQAPSARQHDYKRSLTTTKKAGLKTTGLETETDSDTLSDTGVAAVVPRSKLVTLILDMCSSMFGSGRVVNMDNYYTGPEVAVALSKEKVYIRGTCRSNRAGFPAAVQYSKPEATKVERGTHKMVSDAQYGISCYGWVDGNPVHFLTTADGTVLNEVTRTVGRVKKKVSAPICVKRYNKGMQAVDRHDQLRQTFSLADRHDFKKYYVKIILGLVDMALVNAWIHYKLVNNSGGECDKDASRYNFMDSLAESLLLTDWANFANSEHGISNDCIFDEIMERNQPVRKGGRSKRARVAAEKEKAQVVTNRACVPYGYDEFMTDRNQKSGFACQVCRFEERGTRVKGVVICTTHCLRLCVKSYDRVKIYNKDKKEISDYSWMAPDESMSCWEKAHRFYIPKGLFKIGANEHKQDWSSGNKLKFTHASVSSECYSGKRQALGLGRLMRGRPRRTSKKEEEDGDLVIMDSPSDVDEQSDEGDE